MNRIQLLIARILDGTVPAFDYHAELAYKDAYNDAIFEGCLTNNELVKKLGIPIAFDDEIKKANKSLSDKKLKLYEFREVPSTLRENRQGVSEIKFRINFLISEQYKFFDKSAEKIAGDAKTSVLLDKYNLEEIEEQLSESDTRRVARSYQWNSLCSAGFKPTVYTQDIIDLSNWTNRYESIRQHERCPEEEVMEDDDLLDGWILYCSKGEAIEDVQDGKEMFIPCHSPQDIKEVQSKNDDATRFMIRMREQKIREAGEIKDHELPDRNGIIKF